MKRPDSKTFLPFILNLAIVFDVVNFINNQKLTVEGAEIPSFALVSVDKPIVDGSNLDDRVSEIEGQNRQNVKEMSLLKTIVSEDRKMISQLNGRLSQLEAFVNVINTAATNSNENIYGRAKRPARLLPFHFLLSKEKNNFTSEVERFYGPPTNCSELGKLGYTLNGYYLVKTTKSSQLEIVLCHFHQPPESSNAATKEERIGYVNIDFRDMTGSTTTNVKSTINGKKKREENKSCLIHFHLSHGHSMKEDRVNCLGIDKNPSDSALIGGERLVWRNDCSNNQKEQHWILVVADYNSAAEWNTSNYFKPIRHICNAYYEGKCLTLSSDGTSAVTLSSFNSSDKLQKWNAPFSTDPTATPIKHFDLKKCITRKASNNMMNINKFQLTAEPCNSNSLGSIQWVLSPLFHNDDKLNPVCSSPDEMMMNLE